MLLKINKLQCNKNLSNPSVISTVTTTIYIIVEHVVVFNYEINNDILLYT